MTEPAPGDQSNEVLPRDWAALAPLVDRALDAPPEQRAALMVELAAGDPARQRALEHLVAECERDTPLFNRGAAERFNALAREPDESLLPELIAERYRTGRELGRGGMARVYLARDTKHGRDVAIKVIRADLSASLGHERFLREIEIAARLRHPNIVPLYDSGDVGGSLYFVMPYEEGRSLRDRLRDEGALPIADALSVLRDIARALAYAHEHGVVHRDVKPDNVMLSGDAAVVTDFGIAKAVSAALSDAKSPTLTQAGSGIGTPAYMAPEQSMGDPATDHRADIYSFGCVAYELFTGKPPFPEPTSHQVLAAHLTQAPRPVTELRADVPPSVADLVSRCLSKLPADRPQNVRDVLGVLDGATTTGSAARIVTPATSGRTRAVQQGMVAVALTLLAFAGYRATRAPAVAAPITLSVLPLGNTTGDTTADFLTDGLPDEIATALGRVPGIQIRSRSGARLYRGQLGVDVAEAGAKLGADYVMTGVLRRTAGSWILSADLSRATDRTSIWGESFTINPDQQAGAVQRITASVLASLRSQFPRSVGAAAVLSFAQRTSSSEAFRLYLLGQERLSRRGQSVRESADLFRQAISKDSSFAAAYSGLSLSLALFPYFQGASSSEILQGLESAARKALSLDQSLAQPHVALGMAHWFKYQWDSAGIEFETAIRLDSQNVEARVQYGRHLRFLGRIEESMRELQVARAQDPASALVLSHVAYAFHLLGQGDSAMAESRRALENDSLNLTSLGLGAHIRLYYGFPDEARALAAGAKSMSTYFYVTAKSGDSATARQLIQELESATSPPALGHTKRAFAYLGLGDTASALSALEKATDAREIWPSGNGAFDPQFAPIRRSARYQDLLRRVGLVDPG